MANSKRFDSMAALALEPKNDTFEITVKDDEKNVVYTNKEEPYQYFEVDSLQTALRYFGADLSDDQADFIKTAIESDVNQKSVDKVVKVINGYLKDTAKSNQYAKVLNDNKPMSEESLTNSRARMVRDFMRQSNVDAETAISTLRQFVPTMKEYTLDEFNLNKGRV